jgi:hypothetical protein
MRELQRLGENMSALVGLYDTGASLVNSTYSDDVGFNPSTRHYHRLIYYLYIATCFGRTTMIKLKNILLP